MPSGYRSVGIEFDDRFDFYVEGPKSIDTGLRVGGVDLSQRYAHISFGSKGPDTGFRVNDVDVATLWAAKGTARYTLPFHGKAFAATNQALTGQTGDIAVTVGLNIYGSGTYSITETASGSNGYSRVGESGIWLPPGDSAAAYELMFSSGATSQGTVNNSAPAFAPIGTGKGITLRATINAASAEYREDSVGLNCHLRRNDGRVTVSSIGARVAISGWL